MIECRLWPIFPPTLIDMGTHMKTTIEISDPLLDEAKKLASRDGTTLRLLVEQGLREVLTRRKRAAGVFKLRKASFKGRGLNPDIKNLSWEQLRELAYSGRGS